MQYITGIDGNAEALVKLFAETFTASDGPGEGRLVGGLARDLLAETPTPDLRVFRAEENGRVEGAAIFSRLTYPEDGRTVFLLAPMAVATGRQRQGIGQTVIRYGLDALRDEGVEVAVTYGDPAYYARVGFQPMTEEQARPPLPLSLPHGWIGQSLLGGPMPALAGPSVCVPALNHPHFW